MDRMARDTKQPEVLRELFEALGNDPFVIAECLARPVLAERDLPTCRRKRERVTGRLASERLQTERQLRSATLTTRFPQYRMRRLDALTDTWTATSTTNAPAARYDHTAVWTGSEMIVWGGIDDSHVLEHRREIQSQHG